MNDQQTPTQPFVILAAIDDSDSASAVVRAAANYARGHANAQVHIVHAYLPLNTKGIFDDQSITKIDEENHAQTEARLQGFVDLADDMRGSKGTRAHLVTGQPTDVILGVASNLRADLVVVGTHDYRGVTRFLLGSVSEVVARKAHCPVMLVRPTSYPASTVPEIEAPCSDCVRTRTETKNAKMWCDRHSEHHAKAVLHYEYPSSYGVGSQTFRP